jgi:hypothetical protein
MLTYCYCFPPLPYQTMRAVILARWKQLLIASIILAVILLVLIVVVVVVVSKT